MEPWRLYGLVVVDSHHFDEEQFPDSDPYLSETLHPDPRDLLERSVMYCNAILYISVGKDAKGSAFLLNILIFYPKFLTCTLYLQGTVMGDTLKCRYL